MEVHVSDLTWDQFIYPRGGKSERTIDVFLNADWRDFESTPASKENPDKSITIFDYHRLLSKTVWKVTHLSAPACAVHADRGTEDAGQTYFRNCRKNLADRKKIIMKPGSNPGAFPKNQEDFSLLL